MSLVSLPPEGQDDSLVPHAHFGAVSNPSEKCPVEHKGTKRRFHQCLLPS
jgi:hypothetical protein